MIQFYLHIETRRAARLEATAQAYWTIFKSSLSGSILNLARTSVVLSSPPSTLSLEKKRNFFFVVVSGYKKFHFSLFPFTHCSMWDTKSDVNFPGTRRSPTSCRENRRPSLTNFARIVRTTSPRYFPLMYFSNLTIRTNFYILRYTLKRNVNCNKYRRSIFRDFFFIFK